MKMINFLLVKLKKLYINPVIKNFKNAKILFKKMTFSIFQKYKKHIKMIVNLQIK